MGRVGILGHRIGEAVLPAGQHRPDAEVARSAEQLAPALATDILFRKMLSAVALPRFISEYLRAYIFALEIALAVAVALFVRRLPNWFRSARAASWPIAQGTIERVNAKTVAGQALGELAYSYVANGERYSGYVFLQFADEQDAWETVDPLKGQSILIRYQSGNPAVSAVRTTDQSFLFSNRQESLIVRLIRRQVPEILGLDWQRWKRMAAWHWSTTKGRVESGTVVQHRDGATWFFLPDYLAEVSFSYCVTGEDYAGRIERSFYRESSAKEFVNSLKGQDVVVRYSQSSPDISFVRNKDLQMSDRTQYQAVSGS